MEASAADASEEDRAGEPPATVLVAQRVRPGCEEGFRDWQAELNRTVAEFTGFLGTEVIAPDSSGGEWIVLYRFDSRANLDRWLTSSERQSTLAAGEALISGPASQQVLIAEPDEDLVTVVVSHSVDPRHETEFLAWVERMTAAERAFGGFRGSTLFRPVPGVQERWTVIFRYESEERLNAWLRSPERRRLLDEGKNFDDFELRRISSPFGSWFSFGGPGGDSGDPTPRWKTALTILVALYPTVVLLTLAQDQIWPTGELWVMMLVGNVVSVGLLTWVVMPAVTRMLRFWLEPAPGEGGARVDLTGAGLSIAFLTLAALAFWFTTTQI